MDDQQGPIRELALFAGAGGGILGGSLLGWRCVCAVERDRYAASVLVARQNDGSLPPFPIWDDVTTFDGLPWRGHVDIVSGGFPCQDISAAGGGAMVLSMGENPASGENSRGWFAKFCPITSSWKTPQCSLLADLDTFSATWPQWGIMRNGACWEQTTPSGWRAIRALITNAIECGYLQRAPTPTVCGNHNRKGLTKKSGDGLSTWVRRFMTPNARDWKDTGASQGNRKSPNLGTQVGGRLNPEWVEWLMGWPIGWTALEPLATDRLASWRRSQRAALAVPL